MDEKTMIPLRVATGPTDTVTVDVPLSGVVMLAEAFLRIHVGQHGNVEAAARFVREELARREANQYDAG